MLEDHIVAWLDELKGSHIVVMNVSSLTTVTETMIICTGRSTRHVQSMANHVMQQAKQLGCEGLHLEGFEQGEWILVDLNTVVVHVMVESARAFYQLEKLWDDSWHDDAVMS